jgi:hypothetical protein
MVQPRIIILTDQHGRQVGDQLQETLRAQAACPPLMPILRAEDLHQWLDGLLHWATDFLVTPLREAEVHARIRRRLAWSNALAWDLDHTCGTDTVRLAHLVGEAPAFVVLKRKLPLLAQCEAPVLLTGETGTGKGLPGGPSRGEGYRRGHRPVVAPARVARAPARPGRTGCVLVALPRSHPRSERQQGVKNKTEGMCVEVVVEKPGRTRITNQIRVLMTELAPDATRRAD